jgi:hypothetical protein
MECPKSICFYDNFYENKEFEKIKLFTKDKWYKIVGKYKNLIYIVSDLNEKIGFELENNENLFCKRY